MSSTWSKRLWFCKKYDLEIKTVVKPKEENDDFKVSKEAYAGPGVIINSKFLNGFSAPENSVLETIKILEEKNLGKKQSNFRLKTGVYQDKGIGVVQFQYYMMKKEKFILCLKKCYQ